MHPEYADALAGLCNDYWYPVYAFLRRSGVRSDDAQDLTQGFFVELMEKRTLKAVRRERGRFRSFLLAALKFYLSHERERDRAAKRGGGTTVVSLDADTAESRYRLDPEDDGRTPEGVFERRWALALLDRTLNHLREELRESANPERSLRLAGYLTHAEGEPGYKQTAAELGMTESAVKVAVHRLRLRFGALVRDEVLQTVDGPDKVDDELRHLFASLERP